MQKAATSAKEWVSTKNAAMITGYNPEYIRQLVRAGQVLARKEGVALKIDPESLAYYKSTRSTSHQRLRVVPADHRQKNGFGARQKVNSVDPRLTSDPYLTDAAIRRHRNNLVIAHLDALSSASPAEKKEQKATYQFLRRSLNQDRLSDRIRLRSSASKIRAKRKLSDEG